ncbi:MAG: fatty acid desaturase [Pseudomonadota bacterium]|nr:fatty acid desaturase [Pseudomonadota bacterium]
MTDRHPAVVLGSFVALVAVLAVSVTATSWWTLALAQVALAFVILRHFCMMHELSHGSLLDGRRANDLAGEYASLVCLTPYWGWKRIHVEHHTWAGWRDRDPTEQDSDLSKLQPWERFLANWAWRLSVPIIGASFCLRTFWNLPRLFRLFPDTPRRRFLGSVALLVAVHGTAIVFFGELYLTCYVPGLVMFLVMADPLMISQHVGVPIYETEGREVRPFRVTEQERFARTLVFPRWFARHVLLGFNYHSHHHARPTVAGHLFSDMPFPATVEENWLAWLVRAKTTPLGTLLEGGHGGGVDAALAKTPPAA